MTTRLFHSLGRRLLSLLPFFLILITTTEAWPYVDCSGQNPIFALQQVTAHYDRTNNSIGLLLNGNFTNTYWAQGYSEAATLKWRTSIQTTIMGTQLYRSEGPACMADGGMIIGGCPTAPGAGTIQTSFNISQSAPFAELMVTMQIIGSNNQSIVCVSVLLEQTMPQVSTGISYLPLALAVLSGSISLAATIIRASVGNGFLGAVATYGLPSEAISVHTPGFFDIVFYTQFMLMTGQLSINYPSFYSTFTALFHWSFLEFANTLIGKGPANATDVLSYGGSGSVNQIKDSQYIIGNGTSGSNSTDIWSIHNVTTSSNLEKRQFQQSIQGTDQEPLILNLGASVPDIGTKAAAAIILESVVKTTPFISKATPTMPAIVAAHARKRELPVESLSILTPPPVSPSVSPSSPATSTTTITTTTSSSSTSTTTTTTSDDDSSTTSSTKSRSPSGPNSRPTFVPTRSTPAGLPTSSTSAVNVIPTITDPFTNTSGVSVPHNVSRFGLEAYAAAIGAFPSALFLGTLINATLAAGVSLVVSAGLLGVAWVMAKENHQRGKTLYHARNFVAGNLLRVWLLLYTPLALSAMYQLTLTGNVGLTIASAASLLIISVGTTIFFTWRILRASSELLLYDDQATLLKYGTLYNTLAQEGTLFFLVTLLVRFLWGLAIAMLSSFGIAQVAVLMVVEFSYILVIGVKWPYSESGDNKFHLFLGIIRIVITGCSIAYIHELAASPDLRQLFAYIQMALHLAVFIVIFALTLWNFIQVCMFWKMRHSDTWRGPTKTYNFEDTVEESDQGGGWGGLAGRPLSRTGLGPGGHRRGIVSRRHDGDEEEGEEFDPAKDRRFTVMSYSSLGSSSQGGSGGPRGGSTQHALHAPPTNAHHQMMHLDGSDDDTMRFGSPAERYRQSRLTDHGRSRFAPSAGSDGCSAADESMMDRRLDSLIPLTGSAVAAMSAAAAAASGPSASSPSLAHSQGPLSETGGSTKNNARQSSPLSVMGHLPQRESYTNFQRMSHQQSDPRTRRMSDITRDGPYLYHPRKEEQDNESSLQQNPTTVASAAMVSDDLPRKGLFAGLVASLGSAFRFGNRSNNTPSGDGSKPKAFEVMRPPRRNYATEPSSSGSVADETGSQAGGDQLRELNSLGISRFFQESDRGYERNRNLFVANPSAMISRTGSLVSTVSGAVPPSTAAATTAAAANARLNRNGSGTAESIRTLGYTRSRGTGVGSGLGPNAAVSTAGGLSAAGDRNSMVASGLGGMDSSTASEHDGTGTASISDRDSRRASSAVATGAGSISGTTTGGGGSQLYPPRHSADSTNNIAEALTIDAPLLLQGGGILRVSKGPEKAVQYSHNKTGQYVESIAESLKDEKSEKQRARAAASGGVASPAGAESARLPMAEGVVAFATPSLLLPSIQTQQSAPQEKQQQHQLSQDQASSSSPSVKSRSMTNRTSSVLSGSGGHATSPTGTGSSIPSSPTEESRESPTTANVAASAGRMHEILGRMFSDRSVRLHSDQEHDSDSILSEEDTASTFSGRLSMMQQAAQQSPRPLQLNGHEESHTLGGGVGGVGVGQQTLSEDAQSVEKYDMLEPVQEDSDSEAEPEVETETVKETEAEPQEDPELTPRQSDFTTPFLGATGGATTAADTPTKVPRDISSTLQPDPVKRASSSASENRPSGTTLMRTFSGPTSPTSPSSPSSPSNTRPGLPKSKQNSISSRPLAQSPLHSPSVQLGAGSGLGSGIHAISTGGGADLSRQSSVQSGTSSARMEYLDATWLDQNPYHHQNRNNSSNNLHIHEDDRNNYLNRNASIGTVRTEASYVTAMSQYNSDEEDM